MRTSILVNSFLKGPAHRKNEDLYFLAPAQTKLMQPISMSCQAPFRSNLQKKNIGSVGVILVQWGSWSYWTSSGSHDTKIGCIRLVWAGAKKYNFLFLLCAGPLMFCTMLWGRNENRWVVKKGNFSSTPSYVVFIFFMIINRFGKLLSCPHIFF